LSICEYLENVAKTGKTRRIFVDTTSQ